MHTFSAAYLKGRRPAPTNLAPRQGTRIREIYDLFYANKGKPITITRASDYDWHAPLTDIYGLDIRHIGRGQYCLVGEWFGTTYIDYIAP